MPQAAQGILDVAVSLLYLVRDELFPILNSPASGRKALSSTPYAGTLLATELPVSEISTLGISYEKQLLVGVLNPGRTGFLALGSEELLEWRVWEGGEALQKQAIAICAIPGARLPEGAQLPIGFPYLWLGIRSSSWGSTGFFCLTELENNLRVIPDLGSDRICWVEVWDERQRKHEPLAVLASAYPAPGGDVSTWRNRYTKRRCWRPNGQS